MVSNRIFFTPGTWGLTIIFLVILHPFPGRSQAFHYDRVIQWKPVQEVKISPVDSFRILSFSGSSRNEDEFGRLPVFFERFPMMASLDSLVGIEIVDPVVQPVDPGELTNVRDLEKVTDHFAIRHFISEQKKKTFLNVSFLPIRKNSITGKFEKLTSFTLAIDMAFSSGKKVTAGTTTYAPNSVLSQGTWYKFGIVTTGLYRIMASDLKKINSAFSSVDPANIRIFGNGGGMLPEANAKPRTDDLREISVKVVGEEDGVFNDGDYILFYGKGPDTWTYSETDMVFHHSKNTYSDYSYYFLTFDNGPGKRISPEPSTDLPYTSSISTSDDYAFHEVDGVNLIKSGRDWFDPEIFEVTTSRSYNFNFPDIEQSFPVKIYASLAARSTSVSTSFSLYASGGGNKLMDIIIPSTTSNYLDFIAKKNSGNCSFFPSSSAITLTLNYNTVPDAIGYLDYLELNARRQLKMSGNQISFRSIAGYGSGQVTEYTLNSPGRSSTVWDVSDPGNVRQVLTTINGDNILFRLATDTLREFVAFDGGSYLSVQTVTKVENQDLHGSGQYDYILITHPNFMDQANRLAEFHRQQDNMNVLVTTPEVIYNEFSSGAQDLCGIRDFIRMLYKKADPGKEPKYVLLFGDASYDYKDRIENNTNFIPAYESNESLGPVNTFVTDDFIGLLGDNEGINAAGDVDVGVGRLPVATSEQAKQAVDKIIHYKSNTDEVKNDWRNLVCFVADDEDNNMHMGQAQTLTNEVNLNHNEYTVNKIFLDAYQQISTPGGGRYPDVNEAINQQVAKGALILNYNGHGGVHGWAHERVLEIPDIKAWQNFDNMPLFVTATCEFSYFDDPSFVSAGEWVFLNPNGGGIALLTTTRPTYADGNIELTSNFYDHAFNRTNGVFPKLGDLIAVSKNLSGPGANTRKFVLLGDPGLTLNYPVEHVVTTSISNQTSGAVTDTINALASVQVSGEIRDESGNRLNGFNGTLFSTVYDKESEIVTLANDGGTPFDFMLRKNIIYKGKVEVTNGEFTFSFIVPKDIAYQYGIGRISYYARSPETDANGYDEDIIVGGYYNGSGGDYSGPEVRLFMNDTNFVSGGITDQNPMMLAIVTDESGVNTVGSGIGHDLVATLDNDSRNQIILNDYYATDLNTYKRGFITYPFFGLSDGWHSLDVKVWDVYNNSATASISFLVVSSGTISLNNLMNYPNPFQGQTTFSFECNQPDEELDVKILIYSFTGKLVKTISQKINSSGFRANTIIWDGTADSGGQVSTGTYLYQLNVTLPDGQMGRQSSKMVVIR